MGLWQYWPRDQNGSAGQSGPAGQSGRHQVRLAIETPGWDRQTWEGLKLPE
jgi:hypothetical protein